MSSDSWSRAEEILDDLLDETPTGAVGAVEIPCERLERVPAELRSEVETLWAHLFADELPQAGLAADAPGLLDRIVDQASRVGGEHPNGPSAGDRIGAWRLLEELGRGGMGVVYRAERADGQFEKQVAIKRMRASLIEPENRRRFLRERQILAELDHESIAGLLDGGVTEEGVPYLVMELVSGEPIDRYCERTGADVRRRLDLFLEVCEAVAAAHDSLIVHRDLKPGNVLVTEAGRVKLLDFGIAGLVEEAEAEVAATVVHAFTPEFASPEQVRLERAGPASDVYSLGVLLYLLLSGRRPYETSGRRPAEVERIVCEQEPMRCSDAISSESAADGSRRELERRARRVRGDLDSIVQRAMAKEIAGRYSSAGVLARDVRNHLDGLPVEARPASVGDRTRRLVARHRVAFVAGAAVALSLVVGLAVAASQAVRASRERDRARAEAAKAQTVSEFLTELFTRANPYESTTPDARELLARGEQKIQAELLELPAVRGDLLGVMSRAYQGLGDYPSALRLSGQALELQREQLSPDDPRLAVAILDHASALAATGDRQRALAAAREALAVVDAGGHLVSSLGERALSTVAQYARDTDPGGAELHLRRAIEIQETIAPGPSVELARLLHELAVVDELQGRFEQGLERKLDALRMLEPRVDPGATLLHEIRVNLAVTLAREGRFEEAEGLYRKANGGLEQRLGSSHPNLVPVLTNLGNLLLAQGRLVEAAPLIERAMAIVEERDESGQQGVGARVNLATLRREQGRSEEALTQYRRALAGLADLGVEPDTASAARIESHVGRTLLDLGRAQGAREHLEAALAVQERLPGVSELQRAESRGALGVALCRLGDVERGLELSRAACEVVSRHGASSWRAAGCAVDEAECALLGGRSDRAGALLAGARPLFEQRLVGGHPARRRIRELSDSLDRAGEAGPPGAP